MADYTRYKTETLERMLSAAETKLYKETMRPAGNWGDGMRKSKLPSISAWERARERVGAIKAELEARRANDER